MFLCVGVFNALVYLEGTPFWVGRERVFLPFSHAFIYFFLGIHIDAF